MAAKEKVFPRGGRSSALSKPIKAPSFSLFDKATSKAIKKTRKKKKKKDIDSDGPSPSRKLEKSTGENGFVVKFVDDLMPSVLHEGSLVLGVVSQIGEKFLNLSLPGGSWGIVSLLNVSQFYKSLIVSPNNDIYVGGLFELFKIGDILPARVVSGTAEEKNRFTLSLDPALINTKVTDIDTGMVLVGSVRSEEDHGYIIDFGIPNVNGFLNFSKIENNERLLIGKLVRCAVVACTASQGVSNVQVSLLRQDVLRSAIDKDSMYPIHSFVPGLQFNLTVTQVMKNGVEVTYSGNQSLKGYIHEDYLPALFPNLEKVKVGGKYVGMLLYVKPLVNVPYFRVMSQRPDSWIYKYGQIVKGKVVKSTRAGVTFRLGKKLLPMKCFVPYIKLQDTHKIIDDELSIENLYPVGKVINAIRVRKIDYMKRCYIGATDKRNVEEKFFSISDIKCGEIIKCKIESVDEKDIHVKFGNLTGVVGLTDATDIPMTNPAAKFKSGQSVEARVMDFDEKTRFVRLTMKPTLLKKKLKLLTSYSDAKPNDKYTGTIISVLPSKLIVRFFNNVKGEIQKNLTPYASEPSLRQHYARGQLVKCYVVATDEFSYVHMSLLPTRQLNMDLTIGERYKIVVAEVKKKDLTVEARKHKRDEPITGIIPHHLISDYPGLGRSLLSTYAVNQTFRAFLVLNQPGNLPVFSLCESIRNFYDVLSKEDVSGAESVIAVGCVYPFIYKYVNQKTNQLTLSSLVPGDRRRVVAAGGDDALKTVNLKKYQLVYGHVLRTTKRTIQVTLELSKVWDKNYHTSLELLDVYLDGVKRVVDHHRERKEAYIGKDIELGSIVTSSVPEGMTGPVYQVDEALPGSVKKRVVGRAVVGKVVWIDPNKRRLCVHEKLTDVAGDEEEGIVEQMHSAQIVYVGGEVIVAELKGRASGRLVFIPRKRHVNDLTNADSPYEVGTKTKLWVKRGRLGNLVAIDRQVTLLTERRLWKSYETSLKESIRTMKRKAFDVDDGGSGKMARMNGGEVEVLHERLSAKAKVKEEEDREDDACDLQCEYVNLNGSIRQDEIKQEMDNSNDDAVTYRSIMSDAMEIDIKTENESEDETSRKKDADLYAKERILLSSSSEDESSDSDVEAPVKPNGLNVGFNWDVMTNRDLLSGANNKPDDSSSENDEEDMGEKKKKKLSKAEREEKAKAEEERLRLIEERLMRADVEPETADDFDRALLAMPNSSALWVKYMAFHLQATEIEKARTVARRALKTIAFNEEREKLNVWVALLNLENLYGNEESLNKTLSEALMCNEPYHIQLHMLNMNGQSSKFDEMEKVGNMIMRKFKDVQSMWHDVGLAYYKVGRLESARNVLQRALPLLEKKKHVDLISQFAQMENKYGSAERAQTLYETILSSFPKRVDVWSCYVDMLVKSNLIDLARQVLERATSQTIPPKKMKILFKKFLAFEEAHGTPERVERVRESAAEYVQSVAAMP